MSSKRIDVPVKYQKWWGWADEDAKPYEVASKPKFPVFAQEKLGVDILAKELVTPRFEDLDVPASVLTPREEEVVKLIAEGHSSKEIAQRLTISIKTVETHVSAVLRKLQLSNRHELTRWATDRRLV